MKVTFNSGYYIVETATREAHYRASEIDTAADRYAAQIKHLQRSLKDLEAIEQYRKERT